MTCSHQYSRTNLPCFSIANSRSHLYLMHGSPDMVCRLLARLRQDARGTEATVETGTVCRPFWKSRLRGRVFYIPHIAVELVLVPLLMLTSSLRVSMFYSRMFSLNPQEYDISTLEECDILTLDLNNY
jgi:hypothetical protein